MTLQRPKARPDLIEKAVILNNSTNASERSLRFPVAVSECENVVVKVAQRCLATISFHDLDHCLVLFHVGLSRSVLGSHVSLRY